MMPRWRGRPNHGESLQRLVCAGAGQPAQNYAANKLFQGSIVFEFCNPTPSSYSEPIPSPKSSSGISRFMPIWIRQASARSLQLPGRVLRPGGAGLIDPQTPLADSGQLAEHRHEAPPLHPLEQPQGLQAVAHGVLP